MRQVDISEVRANVPGFFRSVQKEGAIVYRLGYPLAVVMRYEPIWDRALTELVHDELDGLDVEVNQSDFDNWRDYQAHIIEQHWERYLK